MPPRKKPTNQATVEPTFPPPEPISRRERTALMLIMVLAVGLRFAVATRISIEHWDEAVYASNRFFPDGYPGRYLYAPPLLPALIELAMLIGGPTPYAAVLPNLVFSTLTVLLCWWAARDWFGRPAGLAAAALAAFNDFHIAYTRTALTDPALCFWFLLAVYLAWRALARNRLPEAVGAGIAAGAAWATKYNGWLTVAVALSGFIAWALFERFSRREWMARLPVLGAVLVATLVCWSPVWFSFGPGQYSEVVRNQAGYFVGPAGWAASFVRQAGNLRFFENWISAASVVLALGLPLLFRLRWDLFALAVVLGLEAIPLGVSALLVGPALIGPGLLLYSSYRSGRTDVTARSRRLGAWLVWAWTIGLFISTPAYTPYPRLVLPWLISAFLGTSAICGMLAESKTAEPGSGRRFEKSVRWALIALWMIGPLATLHFQIEAKSGLRVALRQGLGHPNAELVLGRISIQERPHSPLPVPGWEDRTRREKSILDAAKVAQGSVFDTTRLRPPHFICYGEPAIVFNLNAKGFGAVPVPDFSFLAPGQPSPTQPAFSMALPNSQEELKRLTTPYSDRLFPLDVLGESPSDLVLLDKYPPGDIVGPAGRPREKLWLYRIRSQ
jgi:4-amino-4-deoxy-L-arabinose transferase-like glycosyltransferase